MLSLAGRAGRKGHEADAVCNQHSVCVPGHGGAAAFGDGPPGSHTYPGIMARPSWARARPAAPLPALRHLDPGNLAHAHCPQGRDLYSTSPFTCCVSCSCCLSWHGYLLCEGLRGRTRPAGIFGISAESCGDGHPGERAHVAHARQVPAADRAGQAPGRPRRRRAEARERCGRHPEACPAVHRLQQGRLRGQNVVVVHTCCDLNFYQSCLFLTSNQICMPRCRWASCGRRLRGGRSWRRARPSWKARLPSGGPGLYCSLKIMIINLRWSLLHRAQSFCPIL